MFNLTSIQISIIVLFLLLLIVLLYNLYKYLKHKKRKNLNYVIDCLILFGLLAVVLYNKNPFIKEDKEYVFDYESIPEYVDEAYIVLNDNEPFFEDEKWEEGVLHFSELDKLGRCKEAYALLNYDLLPDEERGSIEEVKPSGWQVARYDDLIEDKYLFNRCHLIAFELCGENANPLNLITGTRYMNLNMVYFENQVSSYIHHTSNPVLYRVTPVFIDSELVCRGILLEAKSIYDNQVSFCVYLYNVQPGIDINYSNGDSRRK